MNVDTMHAWICIDAGLQGYYCCDVGLVPARTVIFILLDRNEISFAIWYIYINNAAGAAVIRS